MPLKITYHDTETHADESDGWDELIGRDISRWKETIGDFQIFHSYELVGSRFGKCFIVRDEQNHILEIWTNLDGDAARVSVYNPIFTMEG